VTLSQLVSLSTRKALVWPTKNLEHIVGHAGDIRKHGFSLWGVGWKRRPKIDLPAEGYIVHMQKVVAKGIITDLLSTDVAKATGRIGSDNYSGLGWELYIRLDALHKVTPFSQSRLVHATTGRPIRSPIQYFAYARPLSNSQTDPLTFFKKGVIYRRNEIHRTFGGQSQGGISTPSSFSVVFLFHTSRGRQYGYQDGWSGRGTYLYSGEGTTGDMKFERGNRAVRDHRKKGRHLLLFEESEKRGHYVLLGDFNCLAYSYGETLDKAGQSRQGIVFELMPEETLEEVSQEAEIDRLVSLSDLRRKAYEASTTSPLNELGKKAVSTYYKRSQDVRLYVKRRALGFCEGCGKPAPFETENGEQYLEPHHTIRRADKGPDSPDTVIALCPNCHRRTHHGEDGAEYNSTLKEQAKFVEKGISNGIFQNVAAAIIVDDLNRVLVTKRLDRTGVGDCWEFAGGKIKEGESVEDCLKRELQEELSIQITGVVPYCSVYYDYGEFAIRLFASFCKMASGNINLKDHSKCDWVDIKALGSYPVCPADRLIVQRLCRMIQ